MMLRRACLSLGFASACLVGTAAAQASHSREDAFRLVKRAVAFLHDNPRAAALGVFSDPTGPFRDGDLYLYVLDATDGNLTMLAHGANRGLVGMSQKEIVDAEGKDFNAATEALVRSQGEGWVTYKWPNPVTKKIAAKTSFVQLVDGLIIGAGVYQ